MKSKSSTYFPNLIFKDTDFNVGDFLLNDNLIIRIFDESIPDLKYDWHRDKKDRCVKVLSKSEKWLFQYDNSLPFSLNQGKEFFIKKEVFHKLHKGKGTLVLLIREE